MYVIRPEPLVLKPGSEVALSIISDPHIGAANLDRDALEADLTEARRHGDRIHINGDIFDGITTKDKRFAPSILAPELQGRDDLINAAIDLAESIFAPYADQIDSMACGNHDTVVTKQGNVDPVRLLVERLNTKRRARGQISYAGYCGFVDQRFTNPALKLESRLVAFYHHGAGSSPRGDLEKALKMIDSVDAIWIGHHHQRYSGHLQRLSCSPTGDYVHSRQVRFIHTGSYLKTYEASTSSTRGRKGNYGSDALYPPHGMGGARLIIRFDNDGLNYSLKVLQ